LARGGNQSRESGFVHQDEYVEARQNLIKAWQRHLDFQRATLSGRPRSKVEILTELTHAEQRVEDLKEQLEYSRAWGDGKLEALERSIDDQIKQAQAVCDELGI
jgi:hypothetical protein